MSETPSPQATESPPSDTAPSAPTQEVAGAERTSGWTTFWRAFRRRVDEFDTSRVGKAVISAMIIIVLAVGVAGNLPDSAITRTVFPLLRPIAFASGLDQNWSMFAPTPPKRLEYVEVHVVMADGSDKVWTFPRRNRLMGVAFTHRWRRFKEALLTNPEARPDLAHWVVRQLSGPGDRPARVDILLQTQQLPPPGVAGPGQTGIETLYSENLMGNG